MGVLSTSEITRIFGRPCYSINLTTTSMPIWGKLTCHRKIEAQLRGAFTELERAGLGGLIIESEKKIGGCYNCRKMRGSNSMSHHSWAIAIDINPVSFPWGTPKKQDRRLVNIFSKWGFLNGEVFRKPDAMHFEWIRFIDKPQEGGDELMGAREDILNYLDLALNKILAYQDTTFNLLLNAIRNEPATRETAQIDLERFKKEIADELAKRLKE